MIVFTRDYCPVPQMYGKRIKQLAADYRDRGVALVAINPNDPKAIHLSEIGHTDLGDILPEMKLSEYRHSNYPLTCFWECFAVNLCLCGQPIGKPK